jgi:TRAP-type uncharacterized transport system substrate-binding protein
MRDYANTIRQREAAAREAGGTERRASVASRGDDILVALVMARPEIQSVSDLTNKRVAIDDNQPASNESVRSAIAAAGATEVQLSEDRTNAVDRLISGEVPAAVLALMSPQAARRFPEREGFRVFRIPLLPSAPRVPL